MKLVIKQFCMRSNVVTTIKQGTNIWFALWIQMKKMVIEIYHFLLRQIG